jgi:hypothetical protein
MQELAELWVTDALDAYAHYHPGARQRRSCRIARWDAETLVKDKPS